MGKGRWGGAGSDGDGVLPSEHVPVLVLMFLVLLPCWCDAAGSRQGLLGLTGHWVCGSYLAKVASPSTWST